MAKSLCNDLLDMIRWMQDYERYGGKMTPPVAFKILTLLENSRAAILQQQAEIDILETALKAERRNRHAASNCL